MNDIYIVSGARTAIGSFGGSLASLRPAELGTIVMKAAIERAGISADKVQNVVVGTVVATQPKDAYVSRVAAVNAGVPISAPAMNVNRLCGSGLQAIVSAAQGIALGEYNVAIGAGAESMSNAPHMTGAGRNGVKMGNLVFEDAMLGALHDPFEGFHMGITAENVAERCSISREEQDALAVLSQTRAAAAIANGYFKDQIVPVEIKTRKGTTVFDTDEHVRGNTTLEALAGLKPVFKKDGSVTAGNASGLNDGAGAVVLASGEAVAELGLKPMAKILGWGHAGLEPELMGLGPVNAVPIALKRAGLTLDQMDVIEANEAFAAQACGVAKELGFDPVKTNPNGSGISLGHPIGGTGAILTVKTIYELQRTGGKYGLITMCIGGGQGIAMVVERV
ncbi:acetyl-CoA C-acyltransferase family protein [Novosphingobium sp. MMS21-SN21R]|uniref:acetyl-CoA C-acyltransferase family protein n=1 Tax=Novosphingobium sp. MMS21-SN21R TaxID=2969298 RepID=UPI002885987A|nr:acetyl-CoA C-acyltransferase family protein [Novosphingobium sp. MMS21-SN21R]MDT0507121.1 acetyl-CoA C-acyltransferase family protein [Novosphingobium sp. MMS21-SN21R]